jgi:DNA gyrase/topoisomerase IV subunit A
LPCRICEITDLLSRKDRIHDLILKEGMEIAEKYGTKRRTEIVQNGMSL